MRSVWAGCNRPRRFLYLTGMSRCQLLSTIFGKNTDMADSRRGIGTRPGVPFERRAAGFSRSNSASEISAAGSTPEKQSCCDDAGSDQSAQHIVQKRARESPAAVDRTTRQREQFGDLVERESSKITQLDRMSGARGGLLQRDATPRPAPAPAPHCRSRHAGRRRSRSRATNHHRRTGAGDRARDHSAGVASHAPHTQKTARDVRS